MESAHVNQQVPAVMSVDTDTTPTKVEKSSCPRCDRRRERERGYAREARKKKKMASLAEEVIDTDD